MTRTFLTLTLLVLVFFKGQTQQRKIIDVHFHTRSAGDYGVPPPLNQVTGKAPDAGTNDEILQSNLVLLKRCHVVKAICSGTLSRNPDFIAKDSGRFKQKRDIFYNNAARFYGIK